jgi:hypothetical protein
VKNNNMKLFYVIALSLALLGCVPTTNKVSLPLLTGWYNNQVVYYVTTDVSDQTMAHKMGANYSPRLQSAIPVYPKQPQVTTILERVYAFPNGEQEKNVFASIPQPLGATSTDENYSPIWLMYVVEWKNKHEVEELRSEGAIFKAEARGWITITRTDIVVNCPVVSIDGKVYL